MTIYTSERVLPYVYQCTHKETGKVYIGSRTSSKQKRPSHLDFPNYKTSSKIVNPNFDEFTWVILAEFFNPKDAYEFEHKMISDQWIIDKTQSLNQRCSHDKIAWNTIKRVYSSEERSKRSKKRKGKKHSQQSLERMRLIAESKRGVARDPEIIIKISQSKMGHEVTMETRLKLSKQYIVTSPEGELFNIYNMTQFCRDHHLHCSAMCDVANGKRPHHKGWKCSHINTTAEV